MAVVPVNVFGRGVVDAWLASCAALARGGRTAAVRVPARQAGRSRAASIPAGWPIAAAPAWGQ